MSDKGGAGPVQSRLNGNRSYKDTVMEEARRSLRRRPPARRQLRIPIQRSQAECNPRPGQLTRSREQEQCTTTDEDLYRRALKENSPKDEYKVRVVLSLLTHGVVLDSKGTVDSH